MKIYVKTSNLSKVARIVGETCRSISISFDPRGVKLIGQNNSDPIEEEWAIDVYVEPLKDPSISIHTISDSIVGVNILYKQLEELLFSYLVDDLLEEFEWDNVKWIEGGC